MGKRKATKPLQYNPELPCNRKVGIGCIGSGFIMADCHLVAYRQAGFNPVAIASQTPKNARAVAKRPSILLCDEPTGALDAETGKLVLSVLNDVNTNTNTTTAIITHNVAIGALGDVVVRMSSGEIAERRENERRANVDEIEW